MSMSTSVLPSSPYRTPAPHPRGAELVTKEGKELPLRSAHLRAEVGGGIARAVLEQTFENASDETIRVVYKMPLPADGAVSGYEFVIGDRTIKGRVDVKERARERFEQAIAEGKTAALLEEQRADIFTQEIGNVPAGQTVLARITIDQPLRWLPEGEWELRFPTVIGPRYVDNAKDASEVGITVAREIDARLRTEVRIADTLTEGRRVESPSHAITFADDGAVVLAEGSKLDRDLVLRWAVAKPEVGIAVACARPPRDAATAHHAYALLTIVPPSPDAKLTPVARDLVVLLDTSGSMGGSPLEQAKRVVARLVESLGEGDRLELVEFSDRPRAYAKAPIFATPAEKKKAIAWLATRQASGGTEMHTAVLAAMSALREGAQRQVVLVTDGYIGGEEQIVDTLHERLPIGCRLHVVGVGAAPNRALATALARAGRGTEILAAPGEDVERPTARLLAKTALPVLTDVVIEGDAVVEHAPSHVPDVFAGAPLLAALKLRPEGGEIVVKGSLARGTWEKRVRVPAMDPEQGNAAIAALFAREHVADLETRWCIGRDRHEIDRTIEKVGLVFQIATRRTSWLAVDTVKSVDPMKGSRTSEQPQELPYGTSMSSFGLDIGALGEEAPRFETRAGAIRPMAMPAMMPMGRAAPAPMAARTQVRSERLADESDDAPTAPPPPRPAAGRIAPPASFARPAPAKEAEEENTEGTQVAAPAPARRPSRARIFFFLVVLAIVIAAIVAYLFFSRA